MSRIRFHSDQVYDTGAPGKGPKFPANSTLDQSDVAEILGSEVTPEYAAGFLQRWVRRGVAVLVTDGEEETRDGYVEEAIDLHSLTRAELDALAHQRGVDITEARNKGDVIAALELASEAD